MPLPPHVHVVHNNIAHEVLHCLGVLRTDHWQFHSINGLAVRPCGTHRALLVDHRIEDQGVQVHCLRPWMVVHIATIAKRRSIVRALVAEHIVTFLPAPLHVRGVFGTEWQDQTTQGRFGAVLLVDLGLARRINLRRATGHFPSESRRNQQVRTALEATRDAQCDGVAQAPFSLHFFGPTGAVGRQRVLLSKGPAPRVCILRRAGWIATEERPRQVQRDQWFFLIGLRTHRLGSLDVLVDGRVVHGLPRRLYGGEGAVVLQHDDVPLAALKALRARRVLRFDHDARGDRALQGAVDTRAVDFLADFWVLASLRIYRRPVHEERATPDRVLFLMYLVPQ
mmetsp:Transcript_98817/g.318654  ORF Transcript_98817/g.318654 Transcript_98817/m.318654 type:complete len:338 (-) Transcript_98817:446-1459(-)